MILEDSFWQAKSAANAAALAAAAAGACYLRIGTNTDKRSYFDLITVERQTSEVLGWGCLLWVGKVRNINLPSTSTNSREQTTKSEARPAWNIFVRRKI